MHQTILILLTTLAPITLLLYAVAAFTGGLSGSRKLFLNGGLVSLIGILISVIGFGIISEYQVLNSGILGWKGLGFSIRLDALSMTLLTMITLLGFVILRFSSNYMEGDPRKMIFLGRLAVTIASVELLVLSGNLLQIMVFWVVTSVCLHYLLVFYRHRPQAIAAARKKFIVARLGDLSLGAAIVLLYQSFGTGDLGTIFSVLENGQVFTGIHLTATLLLVAAALLKSAQFPTHGWLIEVVETPTPVSALLHAGLLNAGPFLMVRLSPLMVESTPAAVLLISVGGLTALFASVVYLTQPSIKVSLGYSSVAHMGFSLLLCGLGVYSAAILHVVGHSFYKAHAFLSSGSVIDAVKSQKILKPKRIGQPGLIFLSMVVAFTIFLACGYLLGINLSTDFSLMFIGAVIIMGLSQFLVQVMDARSGIRTLLLSALMASGVATSFIFFEHGARLLLQFEIPVLNAPDAIVQFTALTLLLVFGTVVLIQLMTPHLKSNQFGYQLGVHLRNGLYANVLFDRIIGSLKHEKFKWVNLTVQEETDQEVHTSISNPVARKEAGILIN
jgi:NAD(P)H-quinone oxidoreductase subunit 5